MSECGHARHRKEYDPDSGDWITLGWTGRKWEECTCTSES